MMSEKQDRGKDARVALLAALLGIEWDELKNRSECTYAQVRIDKTRLRRVVRALDASRDAPN